MSFHENTEELVNAVCMLEFANATENWGGNFNSLHEGWAALKEEVDEAKSNFKIVKDQTKYLWNAIKKDNECWCNFTVKEIQENAVKAMKKLAQVWAVCEKMKGGVEK